MTEARDAAATRDAQPPDAQPLDGQPLDGQPRAASGPSVRTVDAAVAAIFVAIGAVVMADSLRIGAGWADDGPESGHVPFIVGLVLVASSLVTLAQALWRGGDRARFVGPARFRLVLAMFLPAAAYVAAVPWLGIYLSSALFLAGFMRWLGRYGWGRVAATALGLPAVLFALFEIWFLVPLPKGPVEAALGL